MKNKFILFIPIFLLVLLLLNNLTPVCTFRYSKCSDQEQNFFNPTTEVIGDEGDGYEYMGFMNLTRENILNLKHPFANTNTLRYPVGFSYSFGFDGALPVLVGAILSVPFGLILAYNITILLVVLINIYISNFFFKKTKELIGQESISDLQVMLGAIIFGMSPYVWARINGHLNLSFVAGFSVLLYALVLLFNSIKREEYFTKKNSRIFGLSLITLAFGSLQYLVLGAYMVVIVVPIFILSFKARLLKLFILSSLKTLVSSVIPYLVIFCITFYGYIYAIFTKQIRIISGEELLSKTFRPGVTNILIPNAYLTHIFEKVNTTNIHIENVAYLGIGSIIVFITFFIGKASFKHKLGVMYLLIVFLFLTAGFIITPVIPEMSRFILLVYILIALILVSIKIYKPILIALFIALIIESSTFITYYSAPLPIDVYKIIQDQRGAAVLNVPLTKWRADRSPLPYFYGKKIFDGYFHWTADNTKSNKYFDPNSLISRFVCNSELGVKSTLDTDETTKRDIISLLKSLDVKTVVVFKDRQKELYFNEDCSNVRQLIENIAPERIVLSDPTKGFESRTVELVAYEDVSTIAEIYFDRVGWFKLDGVLINPEGFNDAYIILPTGEVIKPEWEVVPDGNKVKFAKPISFYSKSGDSIRVVSEGSGGVNRYVTFFYSFEFPDNTVIVNPSFERIYNTLNFDLYQIN